MSKEKTAGTVYLARSKAGHDKGRLYAVIGEENGRMLISDGRLRPLSKPKRKNPAHLQMITHLPDEVLGTLQHADDAVLCRILKSVEKDGTL